MRKIFMVGYTYLNDDGVLRLSRQIKMAQNCGVVETVGKRVEKEADEYI